MMILSGFGADQTTGALQLGIDIACTDNNVCTPKTEAAKQQVMSLQSAIARAATQVGYKTAVGIDGTIGPNTLIAAVMVAKAGGEAEGLVEVAKIDLNDKARVKALAESLAISPVLWQHRYDALAQKRAAENAAGGPAAAKRKRFLIIGGSVLAVLAAATGGFIWWRRRKRAA